MDLAATKKRILSEKMYGDVAKACDRVGVSYTVYKTAIAKDNYDELTAAEMDVLLHVIEIIDERAETRKKLTQC